MSTEPPTGEPASAAVMDCGCPGRDLVVNARGREITVPLGVTLLLQHVLKALQAEFGLLDQSFEVYDVNGTRIRTDQDLREAVIGSRTPLSAKISDATERFIEDQQEELAQIMCALIRENCSESDAKLSATSQEVENLKIQVQNQKRDVDTQLENFRNELYCALGAIKDLAGPLSNAAKADTTAPDSTSALGSIERVTQFEEEFKEELKRLATRLDEMTSGLAGVMAEHEEYLQRVCADASEEVKAVANWCSHLDGRLVKAESQRGIGPSTQRPLSDPSISDEITKHSARKETSPLKLAISETGHRSVSPRNQPSRQVSLSTPQQDFKSLASERPARLTPQALSEHAAKQQAENAKQPFLSSLPSKAQHRGVGHGGSRTPTRRIALDQIVVGKEPVADEVLAGKPATNSRDASPSIKLGASRIKLGARSGASPPPIQKSVESPEESRNTPSPTISSSAPSGPKVGLTLKSK